MTRYEKKSLVGFLGIYGGSSILLLAVIAALFYLFQAKSLEENERFRMENRAASVARQVVELHMTGGSLTGLKLECPGRLGLFDAEGNRVAGELEGPLPLDQPFFEKNGRHYVVDQGTFMHLGVRYVVVESDRLDRRLSTLRFRVAAGFFAGVLFIAGVSFWLGRLFLRPVRREMERMDRFIKDTAHEINTPVSALLMTVGSLEKYGVPEEKRRRLKLSARRISDLYRDLSYLFLREVEQRNDQPIDMEAFLKERTDAFADLAAAKEVAFRLETVPVTLEMDRNRAERLVDNLLSNGIKYGPRGSTVTVKLREDSLSVADQGTGIPPEKREAVFRRYHREAGPEGGFGIGLDIVKNVCDEYGFKIAVIESPEGGALFTVEFHTRSTLSS